MRWELVGRYSKFSEEAELTKPPWPAAAEKGDVAIWPHGRIESSLFFVYHLSREKDPAIVGDVVHAVRSMADRGCFQRRQLNSAAAGKNTPAATRRAKEASR